MTTEKDSLEKLRILAPHWLSHNKSHGAEYEKWAETAEQEGHHDVAGQLRLIMDQMSQADQSLEKLISLLGGSKASSHGHHHHDHKH